MRYTFLFLATFLLLLPACTKKKSSINNFSDEVLVRIMDYQDQRLSDSLVTFFTSENASHRYAAVLAFASVQDTTVTAAIGQVLFKDSDERVRSAAAYALGQTGGQKAYHLLLKASGTMNDEVWSEAIARTAQSTDNITATLSAWGLYRLALRGRADSSHNAQANVFLGVNNDENSRLGAAHYYGRATVDISSAKDVLVNAAAQDKSVFVRMAAVQALRKIVSPKILEALQEMIQAEQDYRVRINIIRAAQPYSLQQSWSIFSTALKDENNNVALAASEEIRRAATNEDYSIIVEEARKHKHWRVRSNLFEAALALSGNKELSEELIKRYQAAENPYEKAALLSALGYAPMQYSFVSDQLLTSTVPVIRSSAAASLATMNRQKLFEPGMQKSFISIYQRVMLLNDAAVIGTIASVLVDSTLGYKKIITDYSFLYEAKEKLTLPRDNESLQPLEAALAYFEGKKDIPPVQNEYNHPIDWNFVKTIPHDQRVLIKTVKGEIEIQLMVEEAPGSVANFLQLTNSEYFNAKNFHRVVPNFVIQGGCNRGDGWGSEDYSIRSEFSQRRYKEGSVGMASAGKDTEGTQWFITHSPTPHLDGRYTIFAEVVRGMDVVHRIEVGDEILSVEMVIH
jgi:cyclophilin family peptidyl-prolyl cis-trans isomerase/HEAT repeat protein